MKRRRRRRSAPPAQATDPMAHITEVKAKHEAALLNKANVVAVGIGMPMRQGQPVGPPGIIVSVTHKVEAHELSEKDLVPQELESVPVWVEEIGQPHATDVVMGDANAAGDADVESTVDAAEAAETADAAEIAPHPRRDDDDTPEAEADPAYSASHSA